VRIIRGKFKTRYFKFPKSFPSRPTTDFAKEGLFNVLENEFSLYDLNILDLCAGTGNITFEFLSRECGHVTAVDSHLVSIKNLYKVSKELDCGSDLDILKSDIIVFLERTTETYDIIFADPPYSFQQYADIHRIVFERQLLRPGGMLIIEHGKETDLSERTHFDKLRKYGSVYFSFFTN
jgi:16S rRNA (guanine(966)-N(2))-methyltransferase RsmD